MTWPDSDKCKKLMFAATFARLQYHKLADAFIFFNVLLSIALYLLFIILYSFSGPISICLSNDCDVEVNSKFDAIIIVSIILYTTLSILFAMSILICPSYILSKAYTSKALASAGIIICFLLLALVTSVLPHRYQVADLNQVASTKYTMTATKTSNGLEVSATSSDGLAKFWDLADDGAVFTMYHLGFVRDTISQWTWLASLFAGRLANVKLDETSAFMVVQDRRLEDFASFDGCIGESATLNKTVTGLSDGRYIFAFEPCRTLFGKSSWAYPDSTRRKVREGDVLVDTRVWMRCVLEDGACV
ncbi:hypothetical protein J8273_2370 [Carpediemonas membranifera]|uniref:Uncharacterized protein n=1 Tax=Carpediemonas membranifera TaxID=201153 RepID=A0A8J6BZY9_9EUKA|nr:hypothetical protein J8273_2370 [Carpediemonas membranifera]|eukprot:KAG9396021.1 hypothetical protein J8273_2370 [Carpediemonas membranifera]